MSKTKKSKIDRAYESVANKHPDITNRRHLELLTRIYIMRQKKIESGLFVLGGFVLTLIASYIAPLLENISSYIDLLVSLLHLGGPVLVIVGACKFAKAMHDPLTPNEAKEFAAYEDRKVNAQHFEAGFYARTDLRGQEQSFQSQTVRLPNG